MIAFPEGFLTQRLLSLRQIFLDDLKAVRTFFIDAFGQAALSKNLF